MRSVLTEVLEPILYAERLVVNYQKSVKTHSLVSSTETKRQMDILEACRFDYDIQFTDVRTFRLKICFFLLKKETMLLHIMKRISIISNTFTY